MICYTTTYTALTLQLENAEHNTAMKNMQLVSNWLHKNIGWILVFDGADQENVLHELVSSESLIYFPPLQKENGAVIITTTVPAEILQQVLLVDEPLDVPGLNSEESKQFFIKRLKNLSLDNEEEEQALKHIVENIGGIPTTLEECASFIQRRVYSYRDYVAVCNKKEWPLLHTAHGDPSKGIQKKYEKEFEMLKSKSETSFFVLGVSAFLNNLDIPFLIFEYGYIALRGITNLSPQIFMTLESVFKDEDIDGIDNIDVPNEVIFKDILYNIREYNLISYKAGDAHFNVRRDIPTIVRKYIKHTHFSTFLRAALCMMLHIIDTRPCDLQFHQLLLPHISKCLEHTNTKNIENGLFTLFCKLQLESAKIHATFNMFSRAEQLTDDIQNQMEDFTNAPSEELKKIEIRMLIFRGQLYRWQGKVHAASETMKICEGMAELANIKGTIDEANMCRYVANSLIDERKIEEVEKYLDRAKEIYENFKPANGKDFIFMDMDAIIVNNSFLQLSSPIVVMVVCFVLFLFVIFG